MENADHKPGNKDKFQILTKQISVALTYFFRNIYNILCEIYSGGGDKKIIEIKTDFTKAKPKVGSKDNVKHNPGGGDIKVRFKSFRDQMECPLIFQIPMNYVNQ